MADLLYFLNAEKDKFRLRMQTMLKHKGGLDYIPPMRSGQNLLSVTAAEWLGLLQKLEEILQTVAFVEERSPQILAEYRQKLEAKVKELLADAQIDENRIAAEVTIFADKICVDEEIVRLRSHVEAMKAALEHGEGVGRKLDFIAQEMNREANTTLSKANDLEVSSRAIDLKTAIEKVREQIQNIE